jgi:hypothetical protein
MSGKKWAVKAYGGVANLELMEFPLPDDSQLKDTDVLVKVLATTATYTDQLIIHGNYRPCPPLPCTPGYDCVGVVIKVGKGVTNVAVGDRVASMPQHGCCATHVVLPAHLVIKVRADVIPEQAVSVVLTGVTAYQVICARHTLPSTYPFSSSRLPHTYYPTGLRCCTALSAPSASAPAHACWCMPAAAAPAPCSFYSRR